jgi:hypothetical protein
LRLEGPQHLPRLVVEDDHDRVEAETPAVAEFPAGHLESPVTDQNQCALAGCRLQSDAGRHAEAHGCVIAGGNEFGVGDVHRREQAVADVRGDRHAALVAHQVVDCGGDVEWHQWRVIVKQVEGVVLLLDLEVSVGRHGSCQQGVDE